MRYINLRFTYLLTYLHLKLKVQLKGFKFLQMSVQAYMRK